MPGPGPAEQGATGDPAPGAPVGNGFLAPKSQAVVEQADPSVQACIEQNIHGKAYDSLAPRDARRKLRRLQVKAECEQRLATR